MSEPAGLYVHLPYCKSRCGYCAFVVTTDDSSRRAYLEALGLEIDLAALESGGASFDSVYLGGGTPSLIPPPDLAGLLERLRRSFDLERESEITLEANPDDVSRERVASWSASGVTRVSLGVQSFDDRELRAVGRRHGSQEASRALDLLLEAGLEVSADLILGLPEQTAESFRASLSRLCGYGVGHVSIYLLELDKSPAIEEDRKRAPSRYLADEAQADLWLEMSATLRGAGFSHYEISNWARPGREARHNLKYWTRSPTIGLGVSSHELWEERRRANVSSVSGYIASLGQGRRPTALDCEVTAQQRQRERIVLGLRLSDGVARAEIEGWVGRSEDGLLAGDWEIWREVGLLEVSSERVRLTEKGFLLSNEILCRFV